MAILQAYMQKQRMKSNPLETKPLALLPGKNASKLEQHPAPAHRSPAFEKNAIDLSTEAAPSLH